MGKFKSNGERIIQAAITLLLFVLIFFMIHYVNDIQGTARVVNYAGLVRGATQRMIKLELSGIESTDKIAELDKYLDGIQNGSKELKLVCIDDAAYQEKVSALSTAWGQLKAEILLVRDNTDERDTLVQMSEDYFVLSDEVVGLSEQYSQACASSIRNVEIAIIALICYLLLVMIKQSLSAIRMLRANRELNEKVYWDEQTDLPNKNKCVALLENPELVSESTCMFMFDLNNLKYVNDNMGHEYGDTLICDFARLIRRGVPEVYFVGRYGGDEFIVIMIGSDHPVPEEIIHAVRSQVDAFNKAGNHLPISYAAGYACSEDFEACTLRVLLAKADSNMYKDKKITKQDAAEAEKQLDLSLAQMIQELEHEAKHDGLTNLWNKTTALSMIEAITTKMPQHFHTMIILDIDDFKHVNDNMGHQAGDHVLQTVSEILRAQFRSMDILARFGGDEFIIFVTGSASEMVLRKKARNLLDTLHHRMVTDYQGAKITVSMGVACSTTAIASEVLFDDADKALYEAKKEGKNRYVLHIDTVRV